MPRLETGINPAPLAFPGIVFRASAEDLPQPSAPHRTMIKLWGRPGYQGTPFPDSNTLPRPWHVTKSGFDGTAGGLRPKPRWPLSPGGAL